MTTTENDPELLRSHPRATCWGPLPADDIAKAEAALPLPLPELVRRWVTRCGVITIERPTPERPHLLLLGLSPGSGIDDDLVMFNRPGNPTLPRDYLVFAHEFDGEVDHVYAVDRAGAVVRTSGFLFPSLDYTDAYANTSWERAFSDLDEFWTAKVRSYLEG